MNLLLSNIVEMKRMQEALASVMEQDVANTTQQFIDKIIEVRAFPHFCVN